MAGPLKLVRKNQGKALIKLGMETGNVSETTAQPTYELLLIIVDHWVH